MYVTESPTKLSNTACEVSGFHRGAVGAFALLEYYAALVDFFVTDISVKALGPNFKFQAAQEEFFFDLSCVSLVYKF